MGYLDAKPVSIHVSFCRVKSVVGSIRQEVRGLSPASDEEGRPRPSESSGFQFCSRCPEELTWPANDSRRRKLLKALEKSAGQQL